MAKRAFDVALTLLVAPFALVIAAVFAPGPRHRAPGNPSFVQERIGLHRGNRKYEGELVEVV